MISATTEFNTQIKKDSRTFRARFLKNGSPIGGEIKKVTINKGACGDFAIGSIFIPYIDAVLQNCEDVIENEELLLQIGLLVAANDIEYINIGYFTVTKPEVSANQTKFTAIGRISSRLNCIPNRLPEEQTLENLANAITETTGVQISCKGVVLAGIIPTDLTGQTCLNILKMIASVLGGFVTEDNTGGIVISKYSIDTSVEYDGDRTISSPEFSEYDYEITGVEVIIAEEWIDSNNEVHGAVAYAEGTPNQSLIMEYMTEELFPAFAKNTVGYKYRPGTVSLALGDPRLEPWDSVSFTDIKGNTYIVPCLNITHIFDGGLSSQITAPGNTKADTEARMKGPLITQIEKVATDLLATQNSVNQATKDMIVGTYDEFSFSSSSTKEPTEGWDLKRPDAKDGIYIWRRTINVYGDGSEKTGTAVCITGHAGADGEDATTLRIESSRGTVFKNNEVSTVLSVVIYKGAKRITDITALKEEFGVTAYLEWHWQKLNDDTFGLILSTDSRISNAGFTFTLSPDDVDTKVTFLCNLIVD